MTEVKTKCLQRLPKAIKETAPDLLSMALWVIASFVASKAFIFGRFAPFGVAAAAASKRSCALPAAFGAIMGYIFSENPENTLRYTAAVLTVFGAKIVFERIANGDSVPVLIAAGSTAVCSFGYAAMTVISGYGSMMAFAETVLSAGAAYFFRRTGITFGKISLGGIAASFVVLVSAGYGKESGGSVAGVAAGTAVSLASGNMSTVLSGYALGGLVSGIFAVFGKLG